MKSHPKSNKILLLLSLGLVFGVSFLRRPAPSISDSAPEGKGPKLYWFIPDGLRADRDQFNIFKWAEEGHLPHLKTLMDRGCRGYSRPVFPGHTPTNFATLMTGTLPSTHGIADGSMRLTGYPLNMVSQGGFSSFAKRVRPLWVLLEKMGLTVTLQSIPGSTPPELYQGNTIKGRWGAWGVDFPAIIFQDSVREHFQVEVGQNRRLFTLGSDLTRFTEARSEQPAWDLKPLRSAEKQGGLPAFEVDLSNWGQPLHARIFQSTRAPEGTYDRVLLSVDRKTATAELSPGEWSDWIPVKLTWELKNDYQKNSPKKSALERSLSAITLDSSMKIRIIRLGGRGEFRIRILYDGLNELSTSPPEIADPLRSLAGPMVDFVDNYPPQLIYFPEDKGVFLEEARMSWDWHRRAVPHLVSGLGGPASDVVIHSTYTPNQMLTSRWWMPFIDRDSFRYGEKSESERRSLQSEVLEMYRQADDVLGEIIKNSGPDTTIVLSSDHGALPLTNEVRLNNLFHSKGWLHHRFNPATKEYEIDWKRTRVIYLQMNNIYIHSKGLAGEYRRDTSAEYRKLRDEVKSLMESLEDPVHRTRVTSKIWVHEEASRAGLPRDRVGDLIVSNAPQYNWTEDLSEDGKVFASTLKGGYKQGVWPESVEGMLTPFVIAGPRIRPDCVLPEPIQHVDQFATLTALFGVQSPHRVEGRVLREIFRKDFKQ